MKKMKERQIMEDALDEDYSVYMLNGLIEYCADWQSEKVEDAQARLNTLQRFREMLSLTEYQYACLVVLFHVLY